MSQRKSVANEDNGNECLWNKNWSLAEFYVDTAVTMSLCSKLNQWDDKWFKNVKETKSGSKETKK